MAERYLTLAEVAERLRVSRWTIHRRLKDHPEIRRMKPGRSLVFTPDAVRALEAAVECRSDSMPPEPEKETGPGSPESRSIEDALRSARARQTGQLLSGLRASSSGGFEKIVLLDRVKR
jgi:excisionase family DNA binding protein